MTPRISVIVPLRASGPWLHECLSQLELQTFRSFDIYIVPDEPLALAGTQLHVIPSGRVLPNRKRQLAALASSAEILAFIDDDAYPDPEWLANAVRHFSDPNVVAAGGPSVTPPGDSPRQRASGAIFAANIVSSSTRRRYIAEVTCDVDVLPSCNLLIRREAFLRDADASVTYWPGEDTLVCLFATRDGKRIVYDPSVLVYHHRRTVFAAHLRQVWSYGRFRGFFLRRFGGSPRYAAYAVPAAFVFAHAILVAALMRPLLRSTALATAGVYVGLVAWSGLREGRFAGANPWFVAAGIYLSHVVYGCASIFGWILGVPSGDGSARRRR